MMQPAHCKKTTYSTSKAAEEDLVRIASKNKDKNRKIPTHWYTCRHCHGIHLTSAPQNDQDAIKPLLSKIKALEQKNHDLEKELRLYKTDESRKLRKELKKESLLIQQQDIINSKTKQIKFFRQQMRDLVTRMIQYHQKKQKDQ